MIGAALDGIEATVSVVRAVLQWVLPTVFAGLSLATLARWARQRQRPAGFLAAAFASIAAGLLVERIAAAVPAIPTALPRDVATIGVAAFAWLLLAFAWSFEPRLPLWVRAAAASVFGLALWVLLLPPLPLLGEPQAVEELLFVNLFIGTWAVLAGAAAVRLWRAGGSHRLVRTRMRLMASGALVLASALLVSGGAPSRSLWQLLPNLLALGAAALFAVGFAPPRPLRMWWRRRATTDWQRRQLDLIAAVTPTQVAEAVAPQVAEVLGTGAVVVDRDGRMLAHAQLPVEEATAIADRLKTGDPPAAGEQRVAADGATLVVLTTPYTPIFGQDEQDLLVGLALQLRLALERARLHEANTRSRRQLEQSAHDLQAMMSGLAHDLRSPITAVELYLDLLPDVDDRDRRIELLGRMRAGTAYLNRLIDSLLELSRLGTTQTDLEPVDLDLIVEAAIDRLAAAHPSVTVHADPLPSVVGNRLALEQVFDNLLTNAAKHGGRPDVTIRISGRTTSDTVVIDVADDGRGIDPGDRELIFAPFQRGRNAGASGHGVGLGFVRRVLESHGGSIELLARGSGAHFQLRLPRTVD
ncbi:sensor histidine kinase [Egicoccus sp. AB-alg2]|uniref:sensor histidine kinase n=1 Tax=Egicoccus sp. AB-alg2 TaxID=3242693 RepID=UPI00359E46DC